MKRNNRILLILVAILAIVAVLVYTFRDTGGRKKRQLRDFAVPDTAAVTKVFLADKSGASVLLTRQDGGWMVNGQYTARRDFTTLLLETIKSLIVSYPVPEAARPKVLRDLAATGIKVEIYQGSNNVKTFYVGSATRESNGTYMIMENSDVPFVVTLPGFNGYHTIRFIPEVNEWRERDVFNYKIDDMRSVSIEYGNDTADQSFVAHRLSEGVYDLTNIDGSPVNFDIDTLKVKECFARAKYLGFEAYILDSLQQQKIDSLDKQPVLATYSVEDVNGHKRTLRTYLRPNTSGIVDDNGEPYPWDIDRLYGIIDNKEAVLIQFYTLDPLTFAKKDFSVKKL